MLYYDEDDTGYDGTAIVATPIKESAGTSYTWDITELPTGDYYVGAELETPHGTVLADRTASPISLTFGGTVYTVDSLADVIDGGDALLTLREAVEAANTNAVVGDAPAGDSVAADLIQFVAIPLAVLTLVAQLALFRLPITSAANLVRTICVLAGAALFAYHATALAPNMNRELRDRWAAAEGGDVAEARAHERAFNERHPRAEAVHRTSLILVVVAVCASAVALGPGRREDPPPVLAEPELLSKR